MSNVLGCNLISKSKTLSTKMHFMTYPISLTSKTSRVFNSMSLRFAFKLLVARSELTSFAISEIKINSKYTL